MQIYACVAPEPEQKTECFRAYIELDRRISQVEKEIKRLPKLAHDVNGIRQSIAILDSIHKNLESLKNKLDRHRTETDAALIASKSNEDLKIKAIDEKVAFSNQFMQRSVDNISGWIRWGITSGIAITAALVALLVSLKLWG